MIKSAKWKDLESFLSKIVHDAIVPGAVAAVYNEGGEVFSWTGGMRETEPQKLPVRYDTMFDLASLTKVTGVTMGAARLMEAGKLDYSAKIEDFFPDPGDFAKTTVGQLLTHTGGFIAEARLSNFIKSPDETVQFILKGPREYEPGTKTVYSCFGFIILGEILSKTYGAPLNKTLAELVFNPLGMGETCFNPLKYFRKREAGFASTEYDTETGLMLSGTVHDENARFQNGVSGNAGIFSTAKDLGRWMRMLISGGKVSDGKRFLTGETVASFHTDFTKGMDEDRGIGFKLYPRPASSSMDMTAFGHTGFTGTSMMVDPIRKAGILLLTNRVHPSREEKRLLEARAEFNEIAFRCFDKL